MSLEEIAEGKILRLQETLAGGARRAHIPGMSRILLGVTGGIAAYKACELTRLLVKAGHEVVPLVTPGAERFVRAETFSALARRPPATTLPAPDARRPARRRAVHREHAREARARPRRQPAHRGCARPPRPGARRAGDEPAHVGASGDARERRAAARARRRAVGPDEGETAEGEWGVGRMAEPEEIAARVAQLLAPPSLAGRRVLVTAGGTREPVDSVRFLGNRSSGRMGVALAEEARRRGAEVVLLAANLAVPAPPGVETIATPTADAMLAAALALADVRPRSARSRGRRLPAGRGVAGKRAEGRRAVDARARADRRHRAHPRRAQARRAGARRFRRRARRGGARAQARDARRKNADLVVFNDVSRADIGFDAAENEVVLVTARRRPPGREGARRRSIAAAILDAGRSELQADEPRPTTSSRRAGGACARG